MGLRRNLIAVLCLALLPIANAWAEARLEFRSTPVKIRVITDQDFNFNMQTFLSSTGNGGKLIWRTFGNVPSWVQLDSANDKLFGKAPAGTTGVFSFGLSVGETGVPDGGTVGGLEITVVSNPVWNVTSVDLGRTLEGSPFRTVDLKPFVSDPNGGTVSIELEDPQGKFPSWLTLNPDGTVTGGTPQRANVGTFSGFNFIARSSSGGAAAVPASGSVVLVFKGPKWTGNPITLPNATEDSPYQQNVSGAAFVRYSEAPALRFEIFDGVNKNWVALSPAGLLEGTPLRPNGGAVSLSARVSTVYDGVTFKDETVLKFNVNLINKPPAWTQNPIVLPDAFTRQPYPAQDLKRFVTDPDAGTNFTFTAASWNGPGQAWATVSSTLGTLSGTPINANLGLNEWVVEVSDGEFRVPVRVQLTVKNRPPTWKTRPVVLKPNAIEDALYRNTLSALASDPEGDPLIFTIVSPPSWAVINAQQQFEGTPRRANIGLQTFQIRVSDALSGGGDTVDVQVTVDKINKPPQWTQNPITLPDAPERSPYSQALAPFVTDPDTADTHRFTRISGPTWATVSPTTGEISGIPQRANLGRNEWIVEVVDPGGLSARTSVVVNVIKVPRAPLCQSPATLRDGLQSSPYAFDLKTLASDADGEALSFAASAAPTWLRTAADGKLSGTPLEADIGPFAAQFTVTNESGLSCALDTTGKVLRTNWPPTVKTPIVFTVKERSTFTVALNNPQYVEDKDPTDRLTFVAVNWPTWATMTAAGAVTLKPLFAQISPPNYALDFTVSDGKVTVTGQLTVIVVRDPRGPQWASDPILFSTLAGTPFTASLADKVRDLDGLPLTFRQVSGPTSTWLTVGADGALSGTAAESDVGDNVYRVSAANDAAASEVTVIVKVRSANRPPVWSKNPVILPDAFVGENYAQSLSAFASDPDVNDALRFLQVTPSPWVFVTSAGLVIGTPSLSDLGVNRITVRVRDPRDASADTVVQITVRQRGQKPKWTKDPIDLGIAYVAAPFSFDLRPFAIDADGDPLQFRKGAAQPAWIQVSALGQVSGTPQEIDSGAYTTVFEVSDDGRNWVPVNAFGKVMKKVTPPKLNLANLFFTVKAGEVLRANLNDPQYVTNPDNDPLTFSLLQAVPWVSLDASGNLTLSPQVAQIGDYSFPLRIQGASGASDQGPLRIKVIKGAEPIKWLEDPIRFLATVQKPFTASLASKVSNPDQISLIYRIGSGPAWLGVDPNSGTLSGTPPRVGDDFFTVVVTPSGQSPLLATMIITVQPDAPSSDSIRIDDPVPGARIDNLWIVDHAPDPCSGEDCFIAGFRSAIEIYYRELAKARVEHYGVYLSSDACRYRKPITDSRGEVLLRWDDRFWVKSFNSRIDRSPGDHHWSSPMTAIWLFLDSAILSVPKPYYEARVPMDMLIVTPVGDMYQNFNFAKTAGWNPSRFLKYFQEEHDLAEKSLRVSAIAPGGSASFQTVTRGTKGKLYDFATVQMDDAVSDYAEDAIFRAFVNAKKRIKLSKVPTDVTSFKVTLAGVLLGSDKWKYDAAANEVEIFWHLIDQGSLKPGDRLVIEYR
jgi:hypothetical protein